jgi:hypothetical protein
MELVQTRLRYGEYIITSAALSKQFKYKINNESSFESHRPHNTFHQVQKEMHHLRNQSQSLKLSYPPSIQHLRKRK